MKLSVLSENCAGPGYLAEHGLSYLIEYGSDNILFDTGATDVYLRNAATLNIHFENITNVVLSHGHWDHGNGLQYLKDKKLIAHPGAFIKRYRKNDKSNIGLALSKENLESKFHLTASKTPVNITRQIIFLGEIPRRNDFEAGFTSFIDEQGDDDFVTDDSALAIISGHELIVVTGCSHSGICNIVEYAKEVTGIDQVKAIIGGFHLKKDDEQTRKTIHYISKICPRHIYPAHCTELPALSAFFKAFKIKQLKSGMTICI